MNTLTCYFKCSEIIQIIPLHVTSTEDIDNILDEHCSMTVPRRRDKSNALQFQPLPSTEFEDPCIIVTILAVSSTETTTLLTYPRRSIENGART
jgi:hypothetical protein